MRNKMILIAASAAMIVLMFILGILGGALPIEILDTEQTDGVEDGLRTHLPIISIDTAGQPVSREPEVFASLAVYDEELWTNTLASRPEVELSATIRIRGSSSAELIDKKQYRLETYELDNPQVKTNVKMMGMKSEKDWILNGPLLDKTLMRNVLMYDLAREMMDWAPDTRFCELVLNGEYLGLYVMIENIKAGDNRLDLRDFALLQGETAYILQKDRVDPSKIETGHYLETHGVMNYNLSIGYPQDERITDAQYTYIAEDYKRFEDAVYGENLLDESQGYASVIDVDSFIDYFILNEFSMNYDATAMSTYLYRNPGSGMKLAVWDFNNSFDNYPLNQINADEWVLPQRSWYARLFLDEDFTSRVIARYRELREGLLSEQALMNRIEAYELLLGKAVERNDAVWGEWYDSQILGPDESGNIRTVTSYQDAVDKLKKTIVERGKFLDENIEALYQYNLR